MKFSTSLPFPDVRILEYSGIDTVSPLDVVAGASGSSITSSSGPVTTTNAYDLIFAANYVSTTTNAAGSGFINRIITNPDGDIAEDQIVAKTGTYTGTAQLNTSGGWVMQTVALRGAGAPPSSDPSVIGQWSGITSWPILPVHATLMPTGKVLAWGHDATNSTTAGTIWTPSTGTFQSTSYSGADLFCAGHGLLPDGRVFMAGGHNMADYHGLTSGAIFNPTTLAWSSAPAMTYGRWYPTVTALPDGRMLVSSGSINCDGCNATVPEIYDPKANTWSKLTTASLNIPIYPHMFVLPDGRVINTGSYELPIPTRALNISTQAWTTIDATVLDAGSAVMYLPGKILKTGTSANSSRAVQELGVYRVRPRYDPGGSGVARGPRHGAGAHLSQLHRPAGRQRFDHGRRRDDQPGRSVHRRPRGGNVVPGYGELHHHGLDADPAGIPLDRAAVAGWPSAGSRQRRIRVRQHRSTERRNLFASILVQGGTPDRDFGSEFAHVRITIRGADAGCGEYFFSRAPAVGLGDTCF